MKKVRDVNEMLAKIKEEDGGTRTGCDREEERRMKQCE